MTLGLLLVVIYAGVPTGGAQTAPAQTPIPGVIVVETGDYQSGALARCNAAPFVQFPDVGADSYQARIGDTVLGERTIAGPPFQDVVIAGGGQVTYTAPQDTHRFLLAGWNGPAGEQCAQAKASYEARFSVIEVLAFGDLHGKIRIVKRTVPSESTQSFAFSGSAPLGQFTLDTDPVSSTPDEITFGDLDDGSYTVSEAVPDGWRLSGLACTDPSGGTTTDLDAASATIDLEVPETVTCTFEDTRTQGLVVNSTGDDPDETAGDGVCDTGGTIQRDGQDESECTLRAAIQEANALADADAIGFDIPGGGQPVISPGESLPRLVGPLVVDATTQPGAGRVELDGAQAGDAWALQLDQSNVTVRGFAIDRFALGGISAGGERHVLSGNTISVNSVGIELRAAREVLVDGNDVSGGEHALSIFGGGDHRVEGNRLEGTDRVVDISNSRGTILGGAAAGQGNQVTSRATGLEGVTGIVVVRDVAGAAPTVTVQGNEIVGPDLPTTNYGDESAAVLIEADAEGVLLGGATTSLGTGAGNRIVPNGLAIGVLVRGNGGRVEGNSIESIGADETPCVYDVDRSGVVVAEGTRGNRVGGSNAEQGNRIVGFGNDGPTNCPGNGVVARGDLTEVVGNVVEFNDDGIVSGSGTLVRENVVTTNRRGIYGAGQISDNWIGTDPASSPGLGNRTGVELQRGDLTGNVISGNVSVGVEANAGQIAGNRIGTDATGLLPLPNGIGIEVFGSDELRIGGDGAGEGNTIAFNREDGILIRNALAPIDIRDNSIRENGGAGIAVFGGSAIVVRENHVYANGKLGFDLGNDGVTGNDGRSDGDTGPNGLQNFPELTSVDVVGGIFVEGQVPVPGLDSATITVDVFANRECDPSGFGEGEVYLGSTTTSGSSADGVFAFAGPAPTAPYRFVTATATGPEGTSEFSGCLMLENETALSSPAAAGSTTLEVASTDGFLGKVVQIGEGATAETNLVAALGSLVLSRPLRFDHAEGEPVVALEGSLFVSVDRAEVRTGARPQGLRALFAGRLAAAGEAEFACGEDVVVNVGGVFEETVAGTRFRVKQGGSVCLFSGGSRGVLSLALDLARGRFELVLGKRVSLAGLANPVELALQVGDDSGSELLLMEERPGRWTYRR